MIEGDKSRNPEIFGDGFRGTDLDDLLGQDISGQIEEASAHIKDKLLKRVQALPEKEREAYLEEANYLLSIIEDYSHPFFTSNFFDYLLVKTKDMEDEPKRDFVEIAKAAYDSVCTAFGEKVNPQDPDSLYAIIWPETNLVNDLGFDRENYERLKKSLGYRIEEEVLEKDEFNARFYRKETLGGLVELLVEVLS